MAPDANAKQIAGDHYHKAYQVWDFVVDTNIHYLVATTVKYIGRWRIKNGLQDLEKGLHYLEKMIECVQAGRINPSYTAHVGRWSAVREDAPLDDVGVCIANFAQAQGLSDDEMAVVRMCATWTRVEDLITAKTILQQMIEEVRSQVS